MNILFLGTAAAEGYPGAFCGCRSCLRAWREGGRSLRKRSSVLIDQELLIDIPPDLYWSSVSHGVKLTSLRSLLVTHSHEDHFCPQLLEYRGPGFSFTPLPMLTLYGDRTIMPLVEGALSVERARLRLRPMSPYRRYEAAGYHVLPIPANHKTGIKGETALNYVIERGRRTFLYASDTGPYPGEVLDFLMGRRFDAIVVECTMGSRSYGYHMNYKTVLAFHRWARDRGVIKKGGKFIATHFAHDGCGTYPEVGAILRPQGIAVAYDGMMVRI
jgi:phosphoribosyl 1,2-cyclic phosphate phosphodiesterase